MEIVRYLPDGMAKTITDKGNKAKPNGVPGIQQQSSVVSAQTMLASCSRDREIRIWNVVLGTCVMTLTGHDNWVNGIAFHPNHLHLYSVSDDKTIRVSPLHLILGLGRSAIEMCSKSSRCP